MSPKQIQQKTRRKTCIACLLLAASLALLAGCGEDPIIKGGVSGSSEVTVFDTPRTPVMSEGAE